MEVFSSNYFLLRTPLLPFSTIEQWGESLRSADLLHEGAHESVVREAWLQDVALLRSRLRQISEGPLIQRAIAVASPSLLQSLSHWREQPQTANGRRTELSLCRYLCRMSSRPTPFGLFAGCSVGSVKFNAPTQFRLRSSTEYHCRSALDIHYVSSLLHALTTSREHQPYFNYKANSTLHRVADGWHYVGTGSPDANNYGDVVKLTSDIYLDATIELTAARPRTFAEIMDTIVHLSGPDQLSSTEIIDYIAELIDSNVLIPDVGLTMTGEYSLANVVKVLRNVPGASSTAAVLYDVDQRLRDLDKQPIHSEAHCYSQLDSKLSDLPVSGASDSKFHVELSKPVEYANLGKEVISDIAFSLNVLRRLARPQPVGQLTAFKKCFRERYESQWVPFLEVLDPEIGIGFGDLGAVLAAGTRNTEAKIEGVRLSDQAENDKRQDWMLQTLIDGVAKGVDEITISEDDLKDLPLSTSSLPDSFAVIASIYALSPSCLSNGDYDIVLGGGYGPSSARAIARFGHSLPNLTDYVRIDLKREEAAKPDAVFAEIVHQPTGRIGNVLMRPVLREYEIPLLGRSGTSEDRQIAPDDLLVGIHRDRIVLFSRRLACEIHPRLSTAHNYGISSLLPHYRFLCALQNQDGVEVPTFKWGALGQVKKLPRIRVGRVILSRARWNLSSEELESVTCTHDASAFIEFKRLQVEKNIPRWVLLEERDNLLACDLNNPLCVESLIKALKASMKACLLEMMPQGANRAVEGPEGFYHNEIVVPMYKHPARTEEPAEASNLNEVIDSSLSISLSDRIVAPGGEWEYVKIYAGLGSLDELLIGPIGALMDNLVVNNHLRMWFFVRYADPFPHLRLRYKVTSTNVAAQQILRLLKSDQRIWKVEYSTYQREIERYGGLSAMKEAERLFASDSAASIKALRAIGDGSAEIRWKAAMISADSLLSDFGFSLPEKASMCDSARDAFRPATEPATAVDVEISKKLRKERKFLDSLGLRALCDIEEWTAGVVQAYKDRSEESVDAVKNMRLLEERNEIVGRLCDIVGSYLHMSTNRLHKIAPREEECIMYGTLARVYKSRYIQSKA